MCEGHGQTARSMTIVNLCPKLSRRKVVIFGNIGRLTVKKYCSILLTLLWSSSHRSGRNKCASAPNTERFACATQLLTPTYAYEISLVGETSYLDDLCRKKSRMSLNEQCFRQPYGSQDRMSIRTPSGNRRSRIFRPPLGTTRGMFNPTAGNILRDSFITACRY